LEQEKKISIEQKQPTHPFNKWQTSKESLRF